ncbi:MAG: KH domain-containing protein [Blastocatellia bacterium]|nr:KH domain-containing protein [Blastocatellia bacterium]
MNMRRGRPGTRPFHGKYREHHHHRAHDREHRDYAASAAQMKNLLEYLVYGLVDNPSEVQVIEHEKAGKICFDVKVARSDMGKILGRGGKTIGCIRSVLRIAASKSNFEAVVDIVED